MAVEWSEGKLLLVTAIICLLFVVGAGAWLGLKALEFRELEAETAAALKKKQALVKKTGEAMKKLERQFKEITESRKGDLKKLPQDEMQLSEFQVAFMGMAKDKVQIRSISPRRSTRKRPKAGVIPILYDCKATGSFYNVIRWLHAIEQKGERYTEVERVVISGRSGGLELPGKANKSVDLRFKTFYYRKK